MCREAIGVAFCEEGDEARKRQHEDVVRGGDAEITVDTFLLDCKPQISDGDAPMFI